MVVLTQIAASGLDFVLFLASWTGAGGFKTGTIVAHPRATASPYLPRRSAALRTAEWTRGLGLTAIIPHPTKLDIAGIFQRVSSERPGMRKVDNTLPNTAHAFAGAFIGSVIFSGKISRPGQSINQQTVDT